MLEKEVEELILWFRIIDLILAIIEKKYKLRMSLLIPKQNHRIYPDKCG